MVFLSPKSLIGSRVLLLSFPENPSFGNLCFPNGEGVLFYVTKECA
jgi:hypothetical protein